MTERFHKGDWSNNICEVYDDEDYIGGVQLDCADEFIDLLNSLNEENKQLKQRNNRQAKQLDRLYNLIEEKDWRKFRTGKCIMQELEWQNLKCSNCGAEMPKYPQYDENKNEIKTCRECGETVVLIRHIWKGVGKND